VTTSRARLPDGGELALYTFSGPPTRSRIGGRRVWMWKTPASLTAGRTVVLSVAGSAAGRARLGFTPPAPSFAEAARATRFTSCAADTPLFSGEGTVGPVTGWGGSLFTLDRRICLPLLVTRSRTPVVLKVPLGTRC
jgi:hypothetical protein